MTFVNKGNGVIVKIEGKKETLVAKFKTEEFKKNSNNIAKSLNLAASSEVVRKKEQEDLKKKREAFSQGQDKVYLMDKYKSKYV
jgi:hypothetical protein